MSQITKAQQLLQSTGFDIWGTSDKELGQILAAMSKAVTIYVSQPEPLDNFIHEWFVEESITVDDDN
jgi:hypothetical protein